MTFIILQQPPLAVVPILIGPLQVLLAILPAILVALGGAILAMLKPSSIKIGMQVLWNNKLSTLAVVAVVAGAIYGSSFIPGSRRGQVAAYQGKAEWTMFRGGLERRGGGCDGAPDPVAGGTVWSFAQNFKTYYSSPAVVGNRVIASAARKEVFADRGGIYCLDAQSGAKVWEFAPSDFRATFSSPSISGDYVVCGEGLHETRDARLFCLSFKDGRKLWEVRTGSHVESSPCFYSNMVFCGAGADGVYGLWPDTKGKTNPVAWHVKGLHEKATFHCDASLAAADGRVYLSSAALHDNDWNGIACLDAATGAEIWHVDTPMPVWGPPTIVSNRLFVGMGNGNFVETAEAYWGRKQEELRKAGKTPAEIAALAPKYAAAGELWAIDLSSHQVLWTRKFKLTLLGAVAAADGKLFFSAMDGLFTCITLDNEPVAQWDAHEGIKTSPAIGKDHVYVVTDSGGFFGLDRRTLKPVWQTRLGNGDLFTSSPAVGNGHIYIGTPENGLICLGSPADQLVENIWAGSRGNRANAGSVDGSSLPARGSFSWRWPADLEGSGAAPPVSGSLACLNQTLYVPVNCGSLTGLAALAVSGSSKAPDSNKWVFATTRPVCGGVAASTGCVYFVGCTAGDPEERLRCLDAANGKELWQVPVKGSRGEILLTTSNIFVYGGGRLNCIGVKGANAGKICWSSAPIGGADSGAPGMGGDLVLIGTGEGLHALRADSGKLAWKTGITLSTPVANDDVAVAARPDGQLVGLSLVNGAELWSVKCEPSKAPLAADENRVYCTTTNGEIVAVSWDGEMQFRLKNAVPGLPPLLSGDKLLYNTPAGLQKVDLSDKNAESRWLASAWLGTITSSPILADGVVYFATAEKGLICARQGKR